MINFLYIMLSLMILGHLLADYPLQGWLAQSKAKSYWEQAPKNNQKDYIAALICHATMWGILVFLPLAIWGEISGWFWLSLPVNIAFHAIVDDLKANKKVINLIQDQVLHLFQITATWAVWAIVYSI